MTRLLATVILTGIIFFPTTLLAEEFECMECSCTCYTHLNATSELPIVTNYKQRGIIRSNSKNRFLDNTSYYLEGMLTRPPSEGQYQDFQEGEGKYAIVIMDSDGDLILGYEYGDITRHYLDSGSFLSGEFSNGTGKYKGISGKFELTKFTGEPGKIKTDLKMHLEEMPPLSPHGGCDHEMCNIMKGSFEITPK